MPAILVYLKTYGMANAANAIYAVISGTVQVWKAKFPGKGVIEEIF